jgi:FHS family L-fucose permease-like MFS transporter
LGFAAKDIAPYVSLYWASLMIGRWTGAGSFTDKMITMLRFCCHIGIGVCGKCCAKHDLTPFMCIQS